MIRGCFDCFDIFIQARSTGAVKASSFLFHQQSKKIKQKNLGIIFQGFHTVEATGLGPNPALKKTLFSRDSGFIR